MLLAGAVCVQRGLGGATLGLAAELPPGACRQTRELDPLRGAVNERDDAALVIVLQPVGVLERDAQVEHLLPVLRVLDSGDGALRLALTGELLHSQPEQVQVGRGRVAAGGQARATA